MSEVNEGAKNDNSSEIPGVEIETTVTDEPGVITDVTDEPDNTSEEEESDPYSEEPEESVADIDTQLTMAINLDSDPEPVQKTEENNEEDKDAEENKSIDEFHGENSIVDEEDEDTPEPQQPESQPVDEEKDKMEQAVNTAFSGEVDRKKVMSMISRIDKKLGITAIEDPNKYDPNNILETVFHTMRWAPGYLNEISVNQLCEWESCLSSFCYYVRSRENHWGVLCDMMKKDLDRAVKLLSTMCDGKTVAEREAVAMNSHTKLQDMQKEWNIYNLYREKCRRLSDMVVQMDNSLKKTIEVRRIDLYQASGNINQPKY